MLTLRTSVICTTILLCLVVLAGCSQATAPPAVTNTPPTRVLPAVGTTTSTPAPTGTVDTTPQRYTEHTILSGAARPDDMAFDLQGRLLFSDFYNGTVSRVNVDGSVTHILSGLAGPEGLVVLSNGTLIIAEQRTNRILSLAPGASTPTVLRALPGTPSSARCKDGVDGIGFDATTQTLIVPDSPTGEVYRLSLDGQTLTPLASGIVRPVGAAVDGHGNIYVADECGGALWRIAPSGQVQRTGGFGMPDDVAFEKHGNILITDLDPAIHALILLDPATGTRKTLASRGFIEPQGLVVDNQDNIFLSDDYANIIVEFTPA